eukprot:scaffold24081_cov362-Cylindrotheca_fusiformis.AAC.1
MDGRPIQFENEDNTPGITEVLRRFLMMHPHIHCVDPAGSLSTLGKWNIETTKDHLDEVKEHIDYVISKIPVNIRTATGFKFFPEMTRMKAKPPSPAVTKYSKWIKPAANAEEASVLTPGSTSQLSGRNRSYPTNPQEASIP